MPDPLLRSYRRDMKRVLLAILPMALFLLLAFGVPAALVYTMPYWLVV